MKSLVLVSTIFLYGGVIAGGGTCGGSDRPRRQCDGPTESFDNYGICCDDQQKEKNEHGERICNFSIVIPDAGAQPDGGIVECPVPDAGPDCEEDKIKVCVPRSVDAGEPDGGPDAGESSDAGCWETIVVCPIGQQLVENRCVDLNPPDAGNVYAALGCDSNVREVIGPNGTCESRNDCTGNAFMVGTTCVEYPTCSDSNMCIRSTDWQCVARNPCTNPNEVYDGMGCVSRVLECSEGLECRSVPFAETFTCNPATEGISADTQCKRLFDCPPGQVMENGTCRSAPFAWTNPCNTNQCLVADGVTCQVPSSTPPLMEIRAKFLETPTVWGTFSVHPGTNDVTLGTVHLDNTNTDPSSSVPVSDLPFVLLVSDTTSGPFATAADGPVRASDRITNCRLRPWPPSTTVTGSSSIAQDGRLVFPGPFTVGDDAYFNLVCDFLPIGTEGAADAFAAELLPASVPSPVTFRVVQGNGNPPRVIAVERCQYTVTLMDGGTRSFVTRPFFERAAGSPSGQMSPGMIEVYRMTIVAGLCDGVSIRWFNVKATYTDKAGNGWGSGIYQDLDNKVRVVQTGQTTNIISPVIAGQEAGVFFFRANFNGTMVVAKGSSRTISVWMDTTGASVTQHDQLTISLQEEVSWVGVSQTSIYPSSVKAPDAAAAVGNTITF